MLRKLAAREPFATTLVAGQAPQQARGEGGKLLRTGDRFVAQLLEMTSKRKQLQGLKIQIFIGERG